MDHPYVGQIILNLQVMNQVENHIIHMVLKFTSRCRSDCLVSLDLVLLVPTSPHFVKAPRLIWASSHPRACLGD